MIFCIDEVNGLPCGERLGTMGFRTTDLNLLKVFEALMTEGSVTRAARKLSLTQPTVSNALRRLRETFDDPLFVRSGAISRPTRRATELWAQLTGSLQAIRHVLDGESFDPSRSRAQLRITMSDYVARIVAPRLMAQMGEAAPHMRIDTLAGMVTDFCDVLADRRADFAIGAYNDDVQRPGFVRSHRLWPVEFFCFMRSGHPLSRLRQMPLKAFLDARHLDVGLAGNQAAIYDLVLQRHGLQRNLVSTVSHYATAYEVVRRSDLIAVLPWSGGLEMTRLPGLYRTRPPLAAPARTIELFWHERHETSAPHQWLKGLLIDRFGRP